MVETFYDLCQSSISFRILPRNWVQVFSPLWAIYYCVTANMKEIKT